MGVDESRARRCIQRNKVIKLYEADTCSACPSIERVLQDCV
jgi:hypothetical protein